jgi:hypothetical protein
MLNESVPAISTPYMRFYELEAMCTLGEQPYVLDEIRDYWGGMLELGATSFWEKYNPEHTGLEHYAMYGRPYGKSLCHAWGASPVYLLGKYYVGIRPLSPGYETFEVRPVLGGLEWFDASVPTPEGDILVYMDGKEIRLTATEGEGYLYFDSRKRPQVSAGSVESLGGTSYRVLVKGDGKEVKVQY